MKLKLCGCNDNYQFGEESNGKDVFEYPAINPAIDSTFKVDSISSYSSYSNHTIIITNDNQALATGNNDDMRIIGSLEKKVFKKFTKFEIKDKHDKKWIPVSAVCGEKYTLYLVLSSKSSDKVQLAFSNSQLNSKYPLFLNTGESNPVALFGGSTIAAAINSDGEIMIISEAVNDNPDELIETIQLPRNEKAISVACCKDFIIALSENHQVFFLNLIESDDGSDSSTDLQFTPVKELKKTKIINISGTTGHCFAITEDGRVFGLGENYNGQLGIGRDKEKVDVFTEIKSLNKYKIKSAYAGCAHSLFQTREGKILACGSNSFASIPGRKPSREQIYNPVETGIDKDATFCICGDGITAIFINFLPKRSPNQIISPEIIPATSSKKESEELSEAKAEINRLKAEITRLQSRVKTLESEAPKKKSSPPPKQEIQIYDQKMVDELRIIELIGSGAQSQVFKAARDQYVALKVLHVTKSSKHKTRSRKGESSSKEDSSSDQVSEWRKFLLEYEIIHGLNHPNIITALGFCFGDKTHSPSIILQFCPHDLADIIYEMDDFQRICAIYEICSGMEAVHAADLIHRDLKPANILIDEEDHVRISDFGLSRLVDITEQSGSMSKGVGTLKFMAPELLNESTHYTNKVDVYSFGVVLFSILTKGKMPNINMVDQASGKKAEIPEKVNDISKQLILKCWETDPDKRPSFTEIIEFIKTNNFKLIDGAEKKIRRIKSFLSI